MRMTDEVMRTRDLGLGAYLVAFGVPLVGCRALAPGRSQWTFDNEGGRAVKLAYEFRDEPDTLVSAAALLRGYRYLRAVSRAAEFGEPIPTLSIWEHRNATQRQIA
jgi:hypothetical protein